MHTRTAAALGSLLLVLLCPASVLGPRAGGILDVGVDMLALAARDRHGRFGVPHQHRVFRHRHDVVEPRLGIQDVKDGAAHAFPATGRSPASGFS